MIEIIKVDSLKKRKPVKYKDLEPRQPFQWADHVGDSIIFKCNGPGHVYMPDVNYFREGENPDREVIPVDARIEWAFREGE